MDPSFHSTLNNPTSLRIAVIPRLIATLSYSMAALGASLSAFLLFRVLRAMRDAETAGISAVTGGIAEANVPVLVGLYLAVGGGFIAVITAAVRLVVPTSTVSPPGWFYLITGALSALSVGVLWLTESIFIHALYPGSSGISYAASQIQSHLTFTLVAGPISTLLLLVFSVWPMKSNSQAKWPGILALVIIQIVLIAVTIAFQIRTSWLWRVMAAESFG